MAHDIRLICVGMLTRSGRRLLGSGTGHYARLRVVATGCAHDAGWWQFLEGSPERQIPLPPHDACHRAQDAHDPDGDRPGHEGRDHAGRPVLLVVRGNHAGEDDREDCLHAPARVLPCRRRRGTGAAKRTACDYTTAVPAMLTLAACRSVSGVTGCRGVRYQPRSWLSAPNTTA